MLHVTLLAPRILEDLWTPALIYHTAGVYKVLQQTFLITK